MKKGTFKDVAKEIKHLHKTGIPRCPHCHKDYVNAFDSIAKKVSEYCWKPTCKCIKKDIRVSIG